MNTSAELALHGFLMQNALFAGKILCVIAITDKSFTQYFMNIAPCRLAADPPIVIV